MHTDYILDQEFRDQTFDDTNTKFKDFENMECYILALIHLFATLAAAGSPKSVLLSKNKRAKSKEDLPLP